LTIGIRGADLPFPSYPVARFLFGPPPGVSAHRLAAGGNPWGFRPPRRCGATKPQGFPPTAPLRWYETPSPSVFYARPVTSVCGTPGVSAHRLAAGGNPGGFRPPRRCGATKPQGFPPTAPLRCYETAGTARIYRHENCAICEASRRSSFIFVDAPFPMAVRVLTASVLQITFFDDVRMQ
jgi:hypothetical protein